MQNFKSFMSLVLTISMCHLAKAADVFECTDKKQRKQNITSVLVTSRDLYCRCPRSAVGEQEPIVKKVQKKGDCKSPCKLADNTNSTDRCQIASDVISEKWRHYECPQGCSKQTISASSEPSKEERAKGKKAKADCQFIKEVVCEPELIQDSDEMAH